MTAVQSASAEESDAMLRDVDGLIWISHWTGVSHRALLLAYLRLQPLSERDCNRLRALQVQLT